jgi:RNA polymerase sigma-70 factor (ECF subfamily)
MLEITRNEARRVRNRRGSRPSTTIVDAAPPERELEDDQLTGATNRLTIQQALSRLRDADRTVLQLRYGEDLTQTEVARRLGLPEGTVKVRLHRARRRLRNVLEGQA